MLIKNTLSYIKNKDKAILLSSYYKIDYDNFIVTIDYYYEKATDVIFPRNKKKDLLELRPEVFQRISDIAECFPKKYKLIIELEIDDYQGYSSSAIMEAISSELELHYYLTVEERDSRWIKALMFLSISSLFLILNNLLQQITDMDLVFFMPVVVALVEVFGWVFGWVSVECVAFPEIRYQGILRYIHKKLKKIVFKDAEDDKTLCEYTAKNINNGWNIETNAHILGKIFILVSIFVIWFMTLTSIANCFTVEDLIYDEAGIIDYITYGLVLAFYIWHIITYIILWKSLRINVGLKIVINILFLLSVLQLMYLIIGTYVLQVDVAVGTYLYFWITADIASIISFIGYKLYVTKTGIEKFLAPYKK